jgi:ribonuclease HI
MLGNLKILQVNLNKSTTATESTLQLAIELKANIIAVQEPWLAPTNNDNYAQARSTIHQAFFQILPTADPSIRPRVMFYISRTLAAETYTLQNFKKDPDAMAIVVKGDNYQIHLINLYNQTNAEGTKTIPRVLLETQLPPSSILVLDCNEHHPLWDPLSPTTSQGAQRFIDWIENQDLELLNTPGVGTFFRPHLAREPVLDLSLVTPDLASKATDWQVTTETGSDHYGILFSIQTSNNQTDNPTNQPRFNTTKANWPTFNDKLEIAINNNNTLQQMDNLSDPRKADSKRLLLEEDNELKKQLEDIGLAITLVIQEAANKAIPRAKLGPKPKAWWNEELTKLRKDTTHHRRIYKERLDATSIQDAYIQKRDFLLARNKYSNAIKEAKKKHWNDFLEQEDPKSIYKAMAYTRDSKVERIPPILGETTFSRKCQAFRTALFPPPPTTEAPTFASYQESNWDWPPLSIAELERACSSKIKSSTPGPDTITQDIIIAAYKAQPQVLYKAFSILFNYGYHPTCWKQATGAILKKPSKPDYSIPKAYRVITLLSCLGKIAERITANRLSNLAETTHLLDPTQIGGRLQKSAIDAALLLVDQIQHQKQRGQITSTIFLDVKGAFDHVSHNQFLQTMKKLGLPVSLIAWAKSFLSNRTLRLSFDNKTEEFSEIIAGIPQGSPVSPIFFLIYIRDLFPGLQSFNLSYIDDLSLSTSSTSIKKNVKLLERQIALLFQRGKELAIMFDIAKTELIHFTAKAERKERTLQLPDSTTVAPKDNIKWLGIYLDNRLSFKGHIATRTNQARQAFYRLNRLANSERGLSPQAIRQLYLACVTSVADYGSPIYWKAQSYAISMLQPLHNIACRKIIGAFRTSPVLPTSIEAGLTTPAIRLNTATRKYAIRATQLDSTHPIPIAMARLRSTNLHIQKKPGQYRQLATIANAIPALDEQTEKIIPHRFRPWDNLSYTVVVSRKTKEEEAIAHAEYIRSRNKDNFIAIYSDASQLKGGIGIGVGLAAYNAAQQEIHSRKTNIGPFQLVYNGELEGIAQAFEYAATIAEKDQEINVFADNQAAIYRLKSLSNNPGQCWLLRCRKAAKKIRTKKATIYLLWAPGHTNVKGNERADALAKEATKDGLVISETTSYAYLGTEIKKIQTSEQRKEYEIYKKKTMSTKRTSYAKTYPLTLTTTIKTPRELPREITSAFYSIKLGHGYFNSYLERFQKRDSNLCSCYKVQTPEHLLLQCPLYKTERKQLKQTIQHRPITLLLLLHTRAGIEATIAFITSTRIGTRKWYRGQTTNEQTVTV